ncbi:MAG: SCP2 sterol-binding domain-containing protein [Pseudomonadota bacterium]|nr:MAG: hypothetical protein DIU78_04020 [Pseudomonadota bacterium]
MPEPSVFEELRRANALLAREAEAAYRDVAERLARVPVVIRVDDEVLFVRASARGIDVRRGPGPARVEIATTRALLADLLEGELSVLDAVVNGRLFLRGSVDDLLALERAIGAYLHGAIRVPRFESLLAAFVAATRRERLASEIAHERPKAGCSP